MKLKLIASAMTALCLASAAQADESVLILGKGGGDIGGLFAVTPPDLTTLAKRSDGKFPFAKSYNIIISGQTVAGHGPHEMPVWGDYFMADALQDRGLSNSDAIFAAAGRALSVTYYRESIQE